MGDSQSWCDWFTRQQLLSSELRDQIIKIYKVWKACGGARGAVGGSPHSNTLTIHPNTSPFNNLEKAFRLNMCYSFTNAESAPSLILATKFSGPPGTFCSTPPIISNNITFPHTLHLNPHVSISFRCPSSSPHPLDPSHNWSNWILSFGWSLEARQ